MLQNPELILENRLGREQYFIYRAGSKIEPGTKHYGAVLEFQKKNSYRYSIIHDNIAVLFNAQESIYSAGLELMLNPMYKRIADENDNLAKGYNPAKKAIGKDTAQKVYAGLKDRFGENSSKWLALLEKRGLGMDAIAERAMPYIKEEMSFKEMLGLARNILYDNGKGYLSGIKNSLKRAGHYIADEARRLYHDERGFLRTGMERYAAKGYSPNGYSSGGKKAFTLIELLVVIAIIGILAGFLIPAVADAWKKGKERRCLNNLKQFALAYNMYVTDYDGFMPPNTATAGDASNIICDGTTVQDIGPLYARGHFGQKAENGKGMAIFHCPSDKTYKINSPTTGERNYLQNAGSYYISYVVAGTNMGGTGEANISLAWANNPSNKCLMTESSQNHGDGVNALFFGGNVKWILKAPDVFSNTSAAFKFINDSGQ